MLCYRHRVCTRHSVKTNNLIQTTDLSSRTCRHLGIVILTDNRNLIRIIYLIPLTYMIVNLFASCPAMPQHLCRIAIPFTLLCRVVLCHFNLVGFDKTLKFLSSTNNISRFSLRVILVLEERENIAKCYCFGINHISGIFCPLATTCV